MKSILSRGGIEFLAVFLGIVLSLWVDDYRENKELNERLMEDYKKIYLEVNSNITNIENIISQNENYKENEEHLLKILNKENPFNFDKVISLIRKINSPTIIQGIMFCSLINTILVWLITKYWKISIHTLSVATSITIFWLLGYNYILPMLLLLAITVTIRVITNSHTFFFELTVNKKI